MSGCPGEALTALVDGALSPDERDRVLVHLVGCDRCRAEVEALRVFKGRLSRLSDDDRPPPQDLLVRIRGLAVPGVEPGPPTTGGPPAQARPAFGPAEPARSAGRPPARPRGRRTVLRRARRTAGVSGGLLVAGVSLAFALGGPTDRPATTPVDPGSDAFVVDFVSTTPQVPLADPVGRAALLPGP